MLKGIEFLLKKSMAFRTFHSEGEVGRSMIEMLGVLAIIAVLSVGGIAGYSKAMEKFKQNQVISEYNTLIQGLLEHEDDIRKLSYKDGLADLAISLNLVPSSWQAYNGNISFKNQFGSQVSLFVSKYNSSSADTWGLEIWLAYDSDTEYNYNRLSLCRAIYKDLARPLSDTVQTVQMFYGGSKDVGYWGNYLDGKMCGRKQYKCLRDIRPDEIENWCRSCTENNTARCTITLFF